MTDRSNLFERAAIAMVNFDTALTIFANKAAEIERREAEFAKAVAAVHDSVIVDAEGYVKLENLLELAMRFPNPQAFLSAVNSLNQLPVRRCWWCETKLWLGLLRVRWVYFLRSKLAASK